MKVIDNLLQPTEDQINQALILHEELFKKNDEYYMIIRRSGKIALITRDEFKKGHMMVVTDNTAWTKKFKPYATVEGLMKSTIAQIGEEFPKFFKNVPDEIRLRKAVKRKTI